MILIVFCLSFTAFSQNDTLCFTRLQVKEFLTTKVLYNNCLYQYDLIAKENDSLKIENKAISEHLEVHENKTKRNRRIAIGTGVFAIFEGVLIGVSLSK